MKRILLLWILIGLKPYCFAQAIIGKSYVTKANYISVESVIDSRRKFKVPLNTKFRVEDCCEEKRELGVTFRIMGKKHEGFAKLLKKRPIISSMSLE